MLGSWHHSMLIERTVSSLQAQTAKTMFKALLLLTFKGVEKVGVSLGRCQIWRECHGLS